MAPSVRDSTCSSVSPPGQVTKAIRRATPVAQRPRRTACRCARRRRSRAAPARPRPARRGASRSPRRCRASVDRSLETTRSKGTFSSSSATASAWRRPFAVSGLSDWPAKRRRRVGLALTVAHEIEGGGSAHRPRCCATSLQPARGDPLVDEHSIPRLVEEEHVDPASPGCARSPRRPRRRRRVRAAWRAASCRGPSSTRRSGRAGSPD